MIVKISDSFEDFKWAELSRTELGCFLVDLDIFSCEPDHVANVEHMCQFLVLFELFLHLLFRETEHCFGFFVDFHQAI